MASTKKKKRIFNFWPKYFIYIFACLQWTLLNLLLEIRPGGDPVLFLSFFHLYDKANFNTPHTFILVGDISIYTKIKLNI